MRPNDAEVQITHERPLPANGHYPAATRGAPRVVAGEAAQSREKMPRREACIAGGYIATRLADGKSVRFMPMK